MGEVLIVIHPSRVDPDLPAFDVLVKDVSDGTRRKIRRLLDGLAGDGSCPTAERFVREGYELVSTLDLHHTFEVNAAIVTALLRLARGYTRVVVVHDGERILIPHVAR